MTQARWARVDRYLTDVLVAPDPSLTVALEASVAAGLPSISISPIQGQLLGILARAIGARAILEVGTLGGYSTIWLARALGPGGRMVTLEIDPKHAEVARANIARAGLADVVELRLGQAKEALDQLIEEGRGPFDLVFIDADKTGYPEYFAQALRLARRGSLIIVDNVVRNGAVADSASSDPDVKAVRRLNTLMAGEPLVSATVLQTVGTKGYDGWAIALVVGDP